MDKVRYLRFSGYKKFYNLLKMGEWKQHAVIVEIALPGPFSNHFFNLHNVLHI